MPRSDETASPREHAERYLAAQHKRDALGAAYRRLFEAPDGKAVLADLFRQARFFEPTVAPGDPLTTGQNDGRRLMVLGILEQLRWSEFEVLALSRERTAAQIAAMQEE